MVSKPSAGQMRVDPFRGFRTSNRVLKLLLLMCSAGFVGCAETDPRVARLKRSPLRDSKFAATIALPDALRLKEHVSGPAHAWGGMTGTEAELWVFKTDTPAEELVTHFRTELPGATEGHHPVDPSVPEFVWRPPSAGPNEEVVVDIRPGEVQIRESLRPETAAAWRER